VWRILQFGIGSIIIKNYKKSKFFTEIFPYIEKLYNVKVNTMIDFKGNFYVDISEFWELKKRSIETHEFEIKRTSAKWIKFFDNEAKSVGQRICVLRTEVFRGY
jgi:hypothetical protein